MGLRIQNNIEAFNTHRQLTATSTQASKSMEKLSSGYRINRAADDAAGLAISEKMRGQIGGLAQAQRNAQDGISLVQTAEGALNEVHSMLQRVRDLKVQYKNGTLSADDKDAIARRGLPDSPARSRAITTDTKFNGTAAVRLDRLHVPGRRQRRRDHRARRPRTSAATAARRRSELTSLTSRGLRRRALAIGRHRATLADDRRRDQERLDAPRQLRRGAEPPRASPEQPGDLPGEPDGVRESRIRDVDMASEMTKFTKLNILQQAGTSMLAQANQAPQGVLSLLR